ncbi:MAG: CotH kinase family protein [Clostridiaceae bacterium]
MSKEKLKDRLAMIIVALGLVAVIIVMGFSEKITTWLGDSGYNMEYEENLFNTDEIISINIKMDEEQWQELIDNAINEEYYRCDVEVNGVLYEDVGIRAKGNTSLSQIFNDNTTERYSFKIEFDYYIKGQTCMGLDKLVLNNNYADATNMKEYIVYDMFSYLGADASLYNYADISVNGEEWGVYLALEAVEESFALRNYGVSYGELYKPETAGMGGKVNQAMDNSTEGEERQNIPGGIGQTRPDGNMEAPNGNVEGQPLPDGMTGATVEGQENMNQPPAGEMEQNIPNGMGQERPQGNGGGMFSGGGSDLNYIDDDIDSYSAIWDGSIFDTSKSNKKRVIKALKNISEGSNLEEYMDVDNVLKYLAVHTFVVNLDSLSGNMAHNYYLYEEEGQLSIVPWDYNLAFGGFTTSNASDMVNFPIDTPFSSGISLEDREFFAALLENDEYLEKYHSYLNKLVEEYIYGGRFEEVYNHIRSSIDSLVAEDSSAFYSYEEYEAACDMLYDVINLRAESIKGQLDGSIPSTTEGQSADSSSLVDASSIDLKVMGTMNGVGNVADSSNGKIPGGNNGQGPGFNPGELPSGNGKQRPDESTGFKPNFQENQRPEMPGMEGKASSQDSNIQGGTYSSGSIIVIFVCLGGLLLAMIFVKKYKERSV